jgi:DNA-binding CsgD family transcriptional regulator
MAELRAALEGALSGIGQLIMLAGEPGIGKTRTADELASVAGQIGARVMWGRCPEERGAPIYWPWVQAIRSYLLELEPEELRSQLGVGAGDIAQIIPDIQLRLPDLPPPPAIEDPEQARFRLFDSITSFMKRASREHPLLLVLDNLHWADPTSLRLLEFVIPEMATSRILILGTYRDMDISRSHPLFRTLGELTRQRLYQRVLLRGLNLDEVGEVMGDMGGMELPLELVSTVHQQTEGNPLFVREVVRLLTEEGLLKRDHLSDLKGWDFRLPEGIREVIGRRLDRLSTHCNDVLTIASVAGREFSLGLLKRVVRGPQEQLLEALEEAQAARVIEELPGATGRYQFSRALIRQTLAAEVSTTQKVRLHARIAQALEELYGPDAPANAAELAYHFAEAEAVAGTDKLVYYSYLAGEEALAAYAYEEALAHFQRALIARESAAAGVDGLQRGPACGETEVAIADLLFGLGRAQASTYQTPDALISLAGAFEHYAATGDLERIVALAYHPYPGSITRQMTDLHRQALSLLPSESHNAGRLHAVYGLSLGATADYEGAKQAFAQALAIARSAGDTALELRTLASAAQVDAFHLRWQESLDNGLRAIELFHGRGELASMLRAHSSAVNALLQLGNPTEAGHHAEQLLVIAAEFNDWIWLTRAYLLSQVVSHLIGNFPSARDFSDRALSMVPKDIQTLAWRVQLEYQMGEFGEGQSYLEQLLGSLSLGQPWSLERPIEHSYSAIVIPMVIQITGVADQSSRAEQAAQAVLASRSAAPESSQWARLGMALLAVHQGDIASAAEQYRELQSYSTKMTKGGPVTIPRVLGLLAQTSGQVDLAASHFEDGLAFCRQAGYRPELAWTCYDYAHLLLEMRHHKRGSQLLSEARSIATELGMRPLLNKVMQLHENVEVAPQGFPKYPADLTERQVQVLRILATGKTNREIAEELVLSERTVEHHLASIYTKIGARNRAEATVFTLSRLAWFDQTS